MNEEWIFVRFVKRHYTMKLQSVYQQRLSQDIEHRQAMNKQNAKVQLIWFVIFVVVIGGLCGGKINSYENE